MEKNRKKSKNPRGKLALVCFFFKFIFYFYLISCDVCVLSVTSAA